MDMLFFQLKVNFSSLRYFSHIKVHYIEHIIFFNCKLIHLKIYLTKRNYMITKYFSVYFVSDKRVSKKQIRVQTFTLYGAKMGITPEEFVTPKESLYLGFMLLKLKHKVAVLIVVSSGPRIFRSRSSR